MVFDLVPWSVLSFAPVPIEGRKILSLGSSGISRYPSERMFIEGYLCRKESFYLSERDLKLFLGSDFPQILLRRFCMIVFYNQSVLSVRYGVPCRSCYSCLRWMTAGVGSSVFSSIIVEINCRAIHWLISSSEYCFAPDIICITIPQR